MFTSVPDSSNPGVVVTDIKMPFWSMVRFMVKWAIASIPAVIILMVVIGFFAIAATTITAGLLAGFSSALNGQPKPAYVPPTPIPSIIPPRSFTPTPDGIRTPIPSPTLRPGR